LTENQVLQGDRENPVNQAILEHILKEIRIARSAQLVIKANLVALDHPDHLVPQVLQATREPQANLAPLHRKDQTVPQVQLVLTAKQDPKVHQVNLVKLVEKDQPVLKVVQEKVAHQDLQDHQVVKETTASLVPRVDPVHLVNLVQLELQAVQEDPVSPENLERTPSTVPAQREVVVPSWLSIKRGNDETGGRFTALLVIVVLAFMFLTDLVPKC